MSRAKSLVMITIDCLRADHVGFLGYGRPTTPFLDSLALESETVVVPNAIVAGAPTYYSFPSLMASRYPLALGRDVIGLAPGETTLASVLNESGYATAAFLAGNPYLSRRFGYDAGFEVFRDFLESNENRAPDVPINTSSAGVLGRLNRLLATASHKLSPVGSLYDEIYFQYCQRLASPPAESFDALRAFPSADVIVKEAASWIAENRGRPFFLWLHLMDPHAPYYPKHEALEWMGNGQVHSSRARYLNSYWNRGDVGPRRLGRLREEVVALYDAGIRWVDSQIAALVDTLRADNLWGDCALAVTADHGEEFLEHGGRFHPPAGIHEELIRVPLLLRVPGAVKMQPSQSPFSLLHLAPTLLDSINLPAPASFRGRSHWTKLQKGESWNDPAIIECIRGCTNPFRVEDRLGGRVLAIRELRYKLVLDFSSSTEKLFDLQTDPAELHPLNQNEQKLVRKRLLERASQHVAESVQSRDAEHRLHARLRDLQLEWGHSNQKIYA
ncbi:MAG TPA: sulfatase-like hydrolase/transferase [Terriglobales bacterium]|nr:sulfatase-like hydrolase/transferase [Terriglobales bacterium]